jgi:hypothetical protein
MAQVTERRGKARLIMKIGLILFLSALYTLSVAGCQRKHHDTSKKTLKKAGAVVEYIDLRQPAHDVRGAIFYRYCGRGASCCIERRGILEASQGTTSACR